MESFSNEDSVTLQIKYFKIIRHKYGLEYW